MISEGTGPSRWSSVRMLVRSSTLTRGSAASRGCSWPWPTSTAYTRAAPAVQEDVGEPPGARPRVQAGSTGAVDAPGLQRRVQLEPAPPHPGMGAVGEPDGRLRRHRHCRAPGPHAVDLDEAGGNQRLGALAAAGHAAFHQHRVEAGSLQRGHRVILHRSEYLR